MKLKFKKPQALLSLLLVVVMAATGCGVDTGKTGGSGGSSKPEQEAASLPASLKEKGEINIKVIRKIGGDDHTAQFLAGAKQEGEALGFKVDTFSAGGNTAKFLDAIEQAAEENLDAVILSHGDDPGTVEAAKKLRDKGIEVVAFDSNGDLAKLDGVTLTAQKDEALAQYALDELVKVHGPEANIVYLWVDGFPPMVRRNAVYQEVLKSNPGIKEIDRFGVANDNTSLATQDAVTAMLTKYPKGELDAIFATWDAFAIGAARALIEAGRTEVKIYGIDVSNADLQIMQTQDSPWAATAAVDPKLIGAVNIRIAAKKLAGEETPGNYDLDAALITQEALAKSDKAVNMISLAEIIPGWGTSDAFEEAWMKDLKAANAK